ncbi:MAG: histidine phosphatase family protein [Candidatus Pacebacteria bacterium]|nr:histidine phosphatase family protein [Candidatus Paceibacterota bacterium]
MKKVYLVRHGQSEVNAESVRKSFDSPLTNKGHEEAEKLAKRMINVDFDTLISSTLKRALQTAEAISKETDKEITSSDLFVERKRPQEQLGYNKNSDIVVESEKMANQAFLEGRKYKEAESFDELKERSRRALYFFDNLEEEHIVAVTHGMFMRVICAHIILGDSLTPENCLEFISNVKTANTGVTVIEKKKDKWSLLTWNDHSHFADL